MSLLLVLVGIALGVGLMLGIQAWRGQCPPGTDPLAQERLERYCQKNA